MNEIKNIVDDTRYEKTKEQLHVTGGRRQFLLCISGLYFHTVFL